MLESKQKLVNSIVFDKYEEHAREVIKRIKALPDSCRLSGDDSDLTDVWEEFKYQLQYEHSFFYDAYEETIRQICWAVAGSLPPNEMHLLWLWSDGYVDWYEGDTPKPPYSAHDVAAELYSTVCEIGINEPLARDAEEDEEEEGSEEEDDNEVTIPVEIQVALTPGPGGERWSVVSVTDGRDGGSIGDIGVYEFDARSDFMESLTKAVLRALQEASTFEADKFYSVELNVSEGRASLGESSRHFWGKQLPPLS